MTDHRVRREPSPALPENVAEMRAVRPIVWPAYAGAGLFLAIALIALIFNIWLGDELRQAQAELAALSAHSKIVNRELEGERMASAALIASDAQHFHIAYGDVIKRGAHIYLAMRSLPLLPSGKVYQAWIMRKGTAAWRPVITFFPARSGAAVVALPADATNITDLAVTIEPQTGRKHFMEKPLFAVTLQ